MMKKWFAVLAACILLLSFAAPVFAAEGEVIYTSGADRFIFIPGSAYSSTDLFTEFKDVMPGDSIRQSITVKNDRSNNCKVKVYMRALGAHADSVDFLSQLSLTVVKDTQTVMFDAPADQTAQLTDWVYLGTLYSGGECDLTVTLDVPVTLDNLFQDQIGYLDWEFAVEELPVEPSDPSPDTGDSGRLYLWAALMAGALLVVIVLLVTRKKKEEE